MPALILKLCLIGCLHIALSVALYYVRLTSPEGSLPLLSADFVVFILPSLLALVLYLWAALSSRFFPDAEPVLRWLCCAAIAMIAMILSTAVSMMIIVNLLGT